MFDPVEVIKSLIRCPSVSTDPAFAEGMSAARETFSEVFSSMGLKVDMVPTPKHPVILARRTGPESWPHIIIYGHYDVQPPDPLDQWKSPPFEPTMVGTRLFGRGAADNKGPLMVHVTAVARLLEENPELPLRISFLVEGEEEISSPSLPAILEERADDLRGDFILLSDTLNPGPGMASITTGIRGMVSLEIRITGPRQDIHSGMFGGPVLNPLRALMKLCASLHTDEDRVNIPGFYEAVIPPQQWEEDQVARLGITDETFARSMNIPGVVNPNGRTAMESIRYEPTLEFNGIGGGYQGEGEKTIIPAQAFAKISCRLVANQDPAEIKQLLVRTLQERCPDEVRIDILEGHTGPSYSVVPPGKPNTPKDQNPHLAVAFRACDKAIRQQFGTEPLYLREGGSIPIIGVMNQTLGMDCLMLAMGTGENNLHSPNESFDLSELEKGIAVSMSILRTVAHPT